MFRAKKDAVFTDLEKDATIYADKITYFKSDEKVFAGGNSKAINKNNTITASSLEYDKINNIFRAKKDAVVTDLEKDATIYADKITYFKSDEKVFAVGNSKAINKNNTIKGSSLEYDKIDNILRAKKDAGGTAHEKDERIEAEKMSKCKRDEQGFTVDKQKESNKTHRNTGQRVNNEKTKNT